jgi:hypothetical protein
MITLRRDDPLLLNAKKPMGHRKMCKACVSLANLFCGLRDSLRGAVRTLRISPGKPKNNRQGVLPCLYAGLSDLSAGGVY